MKSKITVDDLLMLETTVQGLCPFQEHSWGMLHKLSMNFGNDDDESFGIDRDDAQTNLGGILPLLYNGDYYLLSAFFGMCTRRLKNDILYLSNTMGAQGRVLKALLTHTLREFPRCCNARGIKPADLPASPSPAVARLAQLQCSDSLLDHLRLQVFLFAEVVAQYGAAGEMQWLIEQPCWAPCRPTGLLEVQLAQTALVRVNYASVQLVDRETSDAARAALRVLEMVKQECFQGNEHEEFCLADAMRDMTTRAQRMSLNAATLRCLNVCTQACVGVWSRETHAQFPQRFREIVRVLLCMRHWDAGVWGVLSKDEVDEVCKALAFPQSAWM